MEGESEKQEDRSENSSEYESAKVKQGQALQENWTYFDCKICFRTITHEKTNQEEYAENMDPNKPQSGTCKSCVAKNFKNVAYNRKSSKSK